MKQYENGRRFSLREKRDFFLEHLQQAKQMSLLAILTSKSTISRSQETS